jgi:hypothetical protein
VICERALEIVGKAGELWTKVSTLIPKGEFYRYVIFFLPPVNINQLGMANDDGRYQFALGPPARSLVTSIALARFILHDELVPAFTCASLMGRTFPSSTPCGPWY